MVRTATLPAVVRAVPLFLIALLGACAVATPMQVSSTRSADPTPTTVRLLTLTGDAEVPPAELAALSAQVAAALGQKGIATAESADYGLTIVLARRPANIGVTLAKDGKPDEIAWLSPPRKRNPLASCKPERLQVGLVGRREADAVPAYSGRGELDSCAATASQITAVANALVADFAKR